MSALAVHTTLRRKNIIHKVVNEILTVSVIRSFSCTIVVCGEDHIFLISNEITSAIFNGFTDIKSSVLQLIFGTYLKIECLKFHSKHLNLKHVF